MRDQSGQGCSIWAETTELKRESQPSQSVSADVCIVGAGIAGMTTAYLLSLEGKSVTVLATSDTEPPEALKHRAELESRIVVSGLDSLFNRE